MRTYSIQNLRKTAKAFRSAKLNLVKQTMRKENMGLKDAKEKVEKDYARRYNQALA